MTARYLNLLFSPTVKAVQLQNGSRDTCEKRDTAGDPDLLTEYPLQYIATRDSLYMASVGTGCWPYVQHRGGAAGFVKILGERTLVGRFPGGTGNPSVSVISPMTAASHGS